MKRDFLLEIGCENLPSGTISNALKQIERLFGSGLEAERISFDTLKAMGTPRRLVLCIRGLSDKQGAVEERIIGPPVSHAISPEGKHTEAALGFARSQGVPVSRLTKLKTERGSYLAVVKRVRGRSTVSVLAEKIPQWLQDVRFPKMMRWDASGFRFARPIRWIVSIFGEKALRLKVGGLASGSSTRLSPFYESSIKVEGVDHYFSLMRENGIILDPERRRDLVRKMACSAAAKLGGNLVEDNELVSSVADLIECPVVLAGEFDRAFLRLPREVVVTALKSHQRYFSVEGARGRLRPCFIAFADGVRRNRGEVLKGYERVLQARLADADFYYREDTSRPIEEMSEKLDGIVWLEGLGTLAQKAGRIEELAVLIQSRCFIGTEGLEDKVRRAARLAKADLASEMVKDGKEFTLLQGYIGREYAKVSGESDEVSEAIFEHYLPRFSGDRIPQSETGVVLSVADKLDTVVGCFFLGLEPTGSQDPYALRRHALGVLRILIEKRLPVSLPDLICRSVELIKEQGLGDLSGEHPDLEERLLEFFTSRLNVMLRDEHFDYDLVGAILNTPWENPSTVRRMVSELQGMRDKGELSALVLAIKRVANIIPGALKERAAEAGRELVLRTIRYLADRREDSLEFSSALFLENAEKKLYLAVSKASVRLRELEISGEVYRCFDVMSALVPRINEYFDEVLVNCRDERIRINRISFLTSLYRSFSLYCDFTRIAGEQSPPDMP